MSCTGSSRTSTAGCWSGPKRLLTIAQYREYSGLCDKTIRNMIARGELPAVRVQGKRTLEWRIEVGGEPKPVENAPTLSVQATEQTKREITPETVLSAVSDALEPMAANLSTLPELQATLAALAATVSEMAGEIRATHEREGQRSAAEPMRRPWWAFWRRSR